MDTAASTERRHRFGWGPRHGQRSRQATAVNPVKAGSTAGAYEGSIRLCHLRRGVMGEAPAKTSRSRFRETT